MMKNRLPKRHRWEGWLALTWLLAAVSIGAGVVMVATMGSVEVPSRDFLGNVSWKEEPNYLIWAAAIGQALASLLLAAIFSILNSIYQNSCDLLIAQKREDGGSSEVMVSEEKGKTATEGLAITRIDEASPFYGVLKPGFAIYKLNGEVVESAESFHRHLRKGSNTFEFFNHENRLFSRRLNISSEAHIHFDQT